MPFCEKKEQESERMFPCKEKTEQSELYSVVVRVTGLEPVRRRHTPLKRACLPVPAHSLDKELYYKKYYLSRKK